MRIISGNYKGRLLACPPASVTRPTADGTRESIFNILHHWPDFSFTSSITLDAFAGSGAMGLEALSRGCQYTYFIEKDASALKILNKNTAFLDPNLYKIFAKDVLRMAQTNTPVNLAFFDPPFSKSLVQPSLHHLRQTGWINLHTFLVIEIAASSSLDFPGLQIMQERTYGAAKILFARYI